MICTVVAMLVSLAKKEVLLPPGVYQLLTGIRWDNRGISPTRLSHLEQYTRFPILLRGP